MAFSDYQAGIWVHYSKLPQVTINPKPFHQDPAGLYLFPEEFETEGGWHRYPYKITMRLRPGIKVLEISKLTLPDIQKILEHMGFEDSIQDEWLREGRTPSEYQDRFWDIVRQRFLGEPGRFNKAWRRLGYNALWDEAGVIHVAEKQLVVLEPKLVELVEVEEQKSTGFDEVNQTIDAMAKKFSGLGEIEIQKPRAETRWGEKKVTGRIVIRRDQDVISFEVAPWYVHKTDKVPEAIEVKVKYQGQHHTNPRGLQLEMKFRNFQEEFQNKLFDPKNGIVRGLREVFGDDVLTSTVDIPIIMPGADAPFGYTDWQNYEGMPFGGFEYENHPMYSEPEQFMQGASTEVVSFLRDLIPILAASAEKPLVSVHDDVIEIEIEGKGSLSGHLMAGDSMQWWLELPDEWDFELGEVALIEDLKVSLESRRQGIGTQLVKAFIQTARKLHCDAVFLNASPTGNDQIPFSEVHAFYRSLGFQDWDGPNNAHPENRVMVLELQKSKSKSELAFPTQTGFAFGPQNMWDQENFLMKESREPDMGYEAVRSKLDHPLKLYCDMDGVLSDFDQMFFDHYGEHPPEGSTNEFWQKVDAVENFWTHMPWMPDGQELWDSLLPHNPTILSAPSQSPQCIPGKREWIAEHLGMNVPAIFEQDKYKYAGPGAVLIDDKPENIEKWREAGGIGILHESAEQSLQELQKLLKEPVSAEITEAAKNYGDLYHMTSVGQLALLAKKGFKFFSDRQTDQHSPYRDRRHISLTRNPRLSFHAGDSAEDKYKSFTSNTRIVIDGAKLSERYQIFPYADLEVGPVHRGKDPARGLNPEFEEVVLMPKGQKTIDLKPFIKRVDIYDDPTIPNYNAKWLPEAIKGLEANGIPYRMVDKFYHSLPKKEVSAGAFKELACESDSYEGVASRAFAKATLPSDSDLMEFYNLADAEAWRQEKQEEGEAEWDRMDEKERREEIPGLIRHGYSSHFSHDPQTPEEWAEVREWYAADYVRNAEDWSDTTETMFEKARILTNPTLVRFTNYPDTAFKYGHTPRNLGLTTLGGPGSEYGTLAFAVDRRDLKTPQDWANFSGKYGKYAFQFKVPYAVKAWHVSDYENQVIFDIETARDIKAVDLSKLKKKKTASAKDPLAKHRKTRQYAKDKPEYVFEKEVYNDWQSTVPGSDKSYWEHLGKYRSGHAYGNLPGRIKLFVESFGEPDWVYTIRGKSAALHAIYFQKGKDLIQIWNRGNILSEYPWKEFERQAEQHGLKPQAFRKGDIQDGKGYWLKDE